MEISPKRGEWAHANLISIGSNGGNFCNVPSMIELTLFCIRKESQNGRAKGS